MRRGLAIAVALGAALVSGCSGDATGSGAPAAGSGAPSARPDGQPELTGRLVAYRDDVLRRVVSVQLSAAAPVRVTGVRLETAAYDTPEPGPGADVQPGLPVDLRVPYAAVRCDAGELAATAVVAVDGAGEVRVPLADSAAVLARLQRAECAQQDVRRQVDITLSGVQRTGPDTVTATLSLRRLDGDPAVTITEIGRSTLLAPSAGPPGGPVAVLPAGTPSAQVEVTVRPARCDPHALAESKRSTAFRVFVQVDAAPPLLVLVEPPQVDRDALVAFVVDACRGRG